MVKSNVNCSIESEIKEGARNLNIEFSRALTFGIQFRLAEMSDLEYPPNLLTYKIERLAERLDEANRRIEELEGGPAAREKIKGEYEYPDGCYGN